MSDPIMAVLERDQRLATVTEIGVMSNLRAPFPYFGGKSRIASEVWLRFGDVPRYIEPFAGSLAVLLARPRPFRGREIVNDADGLLVNAWRALAHDPEAVARWADWPPTESDLHARHAWLVGQRESLTARLEGDPDWFDAQAAGWWLWGISLWIGGGWCSGDGPWHVEDGRLVRAGDDGRGIHRRLVSAGDDGRGIHRQLVHAGGSRVDALMGMFSPLAERLRDAMILAGDWRRAVTPAVLFGTGAGRHGAEGACAVFLDPPYSHSERAAGVYARDEDVAAEVREWAIAHGDDPRLRIALCGYAGEPAMPDSWVELPWKAPGGLGNHTARGRANARRERVWFSPHCLRVGLWDSMPEKATRRPRQIEVIR